MIANAYMEHPIPQNVTSFEFHLVGDMTLKQFAYLAAGMGTAYFIFAIILPINQIIAIPLILVSALSGIAFAFLPILDRPLDHWVLSFIKAISHPTKGNWKLPGDKKGATNLKDPLFINRLQRYLQSSTTLNIAPTAPANVSLKRFPGPTVSLPPRPTPSLPPTQPVPPITPKPQATPVFSIPTQAAPVEPLPSRQELDKLVEMAKYAQFLQNKITEAEREIKALHDLSLNPQTRNMVSAQKLQQVSENLKNLVEQTESISRQTAILTQKAHIKPAPAKPPVVVQNKPHQPAQLLLTSMPNVVNGIVTDIAGSYLESVIVIIHNKEGIPVRALKTNKLGQFTGATPLPSGIYTITLEKENLEFETLQVTLEGNLLSPLRISAKKKEVLK